MLEEKMITCLCRKANDRWKRNQIQDATNLENPAESSVQEVSNVVKLMTSVADDNFLWFKNSDK
jgi:hypothetical protein